MPRFFTRETSIDQSIPDLVESTPATPFPTPEPQSIPVAPVNPWETPIDHQIPDHFEDPGHPHVLHEQEDEDPLRVLISWVAPARPYRKKDRSYYTTIAILVVLLILISLLLQEFLLVGVLLAMAFVAYVLGFVPPADADYKVTSQGVTIDSHFYFWWDMESFWVGEKEGQKVIFIQTRLRFPGQLLLVIGDQDIEVIKRAIAKYIPFHEIPPRSFIDNWASNLQKYFPLEKTPQT